MTKNYCDKCGKEIEELYSNDVHLYVYVSKGNDSTYKLELCVDCGSDLVAVLKDAGFVKEPKNDN